MRWRSARGRLLVASAYLSPDLARDPGGFFATADRISRAKAGFALLGRADGIVKVGGRRVDLAEVEERVCSLPGVRDAWVWSRRGVGGRGAEIVALVAGSAEPAAIRRALRRTLPPAALPRRIRRLLDPLAAACVERPLGNPETLLVGVERGADRIGLVLSDALDVAVRFAARREAPEAAAAPDLREALRLSGSARDLLRFAVSEEREAVGL